MVNFSPAYDPEKEDTFSDVVKRIGPAGNQSKGYVVPPRYKQQKRIIKPKIITNFGTEAFQISDEDSVSQDISTSQDQKGVSMKTKTNREKAMLRVLKELVRAANDGDLEEEEVEEEPRTSRMSSMPIFPVVQKEINAQEAINYFTNYTAAGPSEPRIVVTYSFPNFGDIQQPYHFVSILKDAIIFAYDLRYQGTKFTPQTTINSGVIKVTIEREQYYGHILPFRGILGYFELLILAIVPPQDMPSSESAQYQSKEQEPPMDYINENFVADSVDNE